VTRLRWFAPPSLLVLLLGAVSSAQEPLPEERERDAQEVSARAAVDRVAEQLAAYGRGVALSAEQARSAGVDRLRTRPESRRSARPATRALDPYMKRQELEELRSLVLGRLRALDPERFRPEPEPEPAPLPPLRMRFYDVLDLVQSVEDHVTPNVGLGTGLDPSGENALAFASAAPFSHSAAIDADVLFELLEERLAEDLERGSLEYAGGRVLARKTEAQHAQIELLLQELRQARGGLVELEVRVYRMPATLFAELRAQSTGLDDAGERRLAAAVAAGQAELVSAQRALAHDGQRVAALRGSQRAYVADVFINQTGVIPVRSPELGVLTEGLAVEVRPLVDRGTGLALLDVSLSVSRLQGPPRSIRLPEQDGAPGLALELHELAVARTSATAVVPLGRGALLGGVLGADDAQGAVDSVIYVRPTLVRR